MRRSESFQLGEVTLTVQQLPATQAWLLLHRLTSAFSPALASVLGGSGSIKKLLDNDLSSLGGATEKLFQHLTAEEFKYLTDQLLDSVSVKGQSVKASFDLLFQGRMFELMQVLHLAIDVNYANFWVGLAGKFAALKAASPSKE